MLSLLQIIQVILVVVCFLLKTDIAVSLLSVAVYDEEDEPLYHIPNEEGEIEQLLLLHGMYPFVIILSSIQGPDRKDQPKQTYCQIGFPHRMPLNQNHLFPFGHRDIIRKGGCRPVQWYQSSRLSFFLSLFL